MSDYERIAMVIRYLDEHHTEQPDLAVLANYVGLSQFHFHRLFSNWAAITPKDFLQCLTLSHARELLRVGRNILDASIDSGLSGPGRLHDLCVKLESASPDELKSGGEGWTIHYGIGDSPFGRCLLGNSPRGLCHFSFIESEDGLAELAVLQHDWPRARLIRDESSISCLLGRVFERSVHSRSRPSLRYYVQGKAFQLQVWRALLHVKPGALTSYGQLAEKLGKPKAARAVGTAVGQNPLAFLIPCHRVISETGVISGYRWGQERKRAILAWESSHRFNTETPGTALVESYE
jgi:AraC family transcriptional regulator of adaptative response/methylated-DNA-[protein]-cysteine methyltransferase